MCPNGVKTSSNLEIRMDGKTMLGVNVAIIAIFTIFTGLFLLPFRLFLETQEIQKNVTVEMVQPKIEVIEYRKLRLCPAGYQHCVTSSFISNYDRNCTRQRPAKIVVRPAAEPGKIGGKSPGIRIIRPKTGPVTDHILGLMLIVSTIGAFVELVKLRFISPENCRSEGSSRRGTLVEVTLPRRVPREPIRPQMSLDIQKMHRSPLRMFAASQAGGVPPLMRRSSFPTYFNPNGTFLDSSASPHTSRRPSVTMDGETGVNMSVRRARLIRR